MKVGFIRVVKNQRLYGDTYITWFSGQDLLRGATPGQFLMLRCADLMAGCTELTASALAQDPLLPRAMSYHRVRDGQAGSEFSILYEVVGRGTAWLSERQPGEAVYAWGPLGRGFSIRPTAQNLLLVGGGVGIAPLLWLADQAVANGRNIVLIDGARNSDGVFPAALVPPEAEVVVTTEDGSQGRGGYATDAILDYYDWADQVFACGPNPMFAAMAEVIRKREGPTRARGRKSVQVSLESPMGCGTGICYGCAVMDQRGNPRLVCKDGPRFELREIW